MGIGFGSLIPFAFISDKTKDYDIFLKEFRNFMYFSIGFCTFNLLLSLFLFKDQSPY